MHRTGWRPRLTGAAWVMLILLLGLPTVFLVVGGVSDGVPLASAEIYDPAGGSWRSVAGMATPRYAPSATLLRDGEVLVAGGFNRAGDQRSAEAFGVYDPATRAWLPVASLAAPRTFHTATLLPDGHVLVAGGHNRSRSTGLAELFT